VEKHRLSQLPSLPFFKFAVTQALTYYHFCAMLHKRIGKSMGKEGEESKHSIFFVINSQIPSHEVAMEAIYQKHKDKDGMLYVTYQEQESF
jgi:GABA(A) receptor-associated protein